MAKDKQIYYCKECGNEFSRWMGQCPSCKAWNSFVEEKVTKTRNNKTVSVSDRPKATSIKNVSSSEETRISTSISEPSVAFFSIMVRSVPRRQPVVAEVKDVIRISLNRIPERVLLLMDVESITAHSFFRPSKPIN